MRIVAATFYFEERKNKKIIADSRFFCVVFRNWERHAHEKLFSTTILFVIYFYYFW